MSQVRVGRNWPEEDHCHRFFNVLVLSLPSELKRRGEGGEGGEEGTRCACSRSSLPTIRGPSPCGSLGSVGLSLCWEPQFSHGVSYPGAVLIGGSGAFLPSVS